MCQAQLSREMHVVVRGELWPAETPIETACAERHNARAPVRPRQTSCCLHDARSLPRVH